MFVYVCVRDCGGDHQMVGLIFTKFARQIDFGQRISLKLLNHWKIATVFYIIYVMIYFERLIISERRSHLTKAGKTTYLRYLKLLLFRLLISLCTVTKRQQIEEFNILLVDNILFSVFTLSKTILLNHLTNSHTAFAKWSQLSW